jgi:hypothetical protein
VQIYCFEFKLFSTSNMAGKTKPKKTSGKAKRVSQKQQQEQQQESMKEEEEQEEPSNSKVDESPPSSSPSSASTRLSGNSPASSSSSSAAVLSKNKRVRAPSQEQQEELARKNKRQKPRLVRFPPEKAGKAPMEWAGGTFIMAAESCVLATNQHELQLNVRANQKILLILHRTMGKIMKKLNAETFDKSKHTGRAPDVHNLVSLVTLECCVICSSSFVLQCLFLTDSGVQELLTQKVPGSVHGDCERDPP